MKKILIVMMLIMGVTVGTANANSIVLMKTNFGDIKIELYNSKAPVTVKNFLDYVESGFYDGLIFHRVIPGFMIQGGGFDESFKEKDTRDAIINEAENGLSNDVGTIAMARTPDPHSASSQFFINLENNTFLNYKNKNEFGYAVFGKVIEGMDVVKAIAKVKTGKKGFYSDVPKETVKIESVKILFKDK